MSPIVVSVMQTKGGVGKTTLSFLMALHAVDRLNLRVLLVDTDQSRNLTALCIDGANQPRLTIHDIFSRPIDSLAGVDTRALDVRIRFGIESAGSLSLLPASPDLTWIEGSSDIFLIKRISQWLATQDFDLVVIDTPGSMGKLPLAAAFAATHVVSPLEMGEFSISGIAALERLLTELNDSMRAMNPVQSLGYIPWSVFPRSREYARLRRSLASTGAGKLLFHPELCVEHRAGMLESLNRKLPPWRMTPATESSRAAAENCDRVFSALFQKFEKAQEKPK